MVVGMSSISFGVAPWPVLRHGMQRWASGPAATPGCMSLSDGQPISPATDWRDASTPALSLIEQLAYLGWARGQPPFEHTLVSSKLFDVEDPVAWKPYLQCLVGLNDLLQPGQLRGLRSGQRVGYYKCVLATEPHEVPLDAQASVYTRWLAKAQWGVGQDGPGQPQVTEGDDSPFDWIPIAPWNDLVSTPIEPVSTLIQPVSALTPPRAKRQKFAQPEPEWDSLMPASTASASADLPRGESVLSLESASTEPARV